MTELVFILNRRGSMAGLEADTISGFNSMIARQKEKYGWEFLFLGANMDAIATAAHVGIDADRAVTYACDAKGTALNYEVVAEAIQTVRCAEPIAPQWKKRIDEDRRSRKNLVR